jgi:hypothetical protein
MYIIYMYIHLFTYLFIYILYIQYSWECDNNNTPVDLVAYIPTGSED